MILTIMKSFMPTGDVSYEANYVDGQHHLVLSERGSFFVSAQVFQRFLIFKNLSNQHFFRRLYDLYSLQMVSLARLRDLYFDVKTAWLLSQMIVQNTRQIYDRRVSLS